MAGSLRHGGAVAVVMALLSMAGTAQAFEFQGYRALVGEAMRELIAGDIKTPATSLARQDALMAFGIEGCKEYAKANPDAARLMTLVVTSVPVMKTLSPDELEARWGDDGTAGAEAGVDLKTLDQFGKERSYLDTVVHPAKAYVLIQEYTRTQDKQLLQQAKGELTEVLEHLKKIE